MPRKRLSFSAAFKSKVALDVIRGLKTVAELAMYFVGQGVESLNMMLQPPSSAPQIVPSGKSVSSSHR